MAECYESTMTDLVHNLPQLNDLFEDAASDEMEPEALMPSQPVFPMIKDVQSMNGHWEPPLADLVHNLPSLDDLFAEDSVFEETDHSISTRSRQDLTSGMEDQIDAEHCERPPRDLVNDLSMLDELFEEDAVLEEINHFTRIPPEPISCSTKRYDDSGYWDDDEAYYSYSSVLGETSWLAANESTFSSYNNKWVVANQDEPSASSSSCCSSSMPHDVPGLCIDLRMTSLPTESNLSAMIAQERQSRADSTSDAPLTDRDAYAVETCAPPPNAFDMLLDQSGTSAITSPTTGIQQASIGWLNQWLQQNPSRLPSSKELQCLEGLTNLPGAFITNWLTQRCITATDGEDSNSNSNIPSSHQDTTSSSSSPGISPTSANTPTPHYPPHKSTLSTSLPCSTRSCHPSSTNKPPNPSNPSSSQTQTQLYHCTQHCGFTTPRRSDWARHERKRFEHWICPLPSCAVSLTRKEKLSDHLRVVHGKLALTAKQLEVCRVEKDDGNAGELGKGKSCGFCGVSCQTWSGWLRHVGDCMEREWEVR